MQHRTRSEQKRRKSDSTPLEEPTLPAEPGQPDQEMIPDWIESQEGIQLGRVAATWSKTGREIGLVSWLDKQLDDEGRPKRTKFPFWEFVAGVQSVLKLYPGKLPDEFCEQLRILLSFGLSQAAEELRPGKSGDLAPQILKLTQRIEASDLEQLVRLAKSSKKGQLPAKFADLSAISSSAHPKLILGCLRDGWKFPTTSLRIDQSAGGASTALELQVESRDWLGPLWSLGPNSSSEPAVSVARWRERTSSSTSDLLEWSFRIGTTRIIRTALLLKEYKLALLADQVDGPANQTWTSQIDVGRLVRAETDTENRGLNLQHTGQSSLCIWPLALPSLPYVTERGQFRLDGSQLKLEQQTQIRRTWMPLLLSWDPARNRKPVHWRHLTVSESFKKCKPETAFAVRVGF